VLLLDGDSEGIKITQVGNTSLSNFTNVFLGVTIGLAILAGTIISICFTSYTVAVGTAVYAEKLVRAFGVLLGAVRGEMGTGYIRYCHPGWWHNEQSCA
jgi:hypothetical protein